MFAGLRFRGVDHECVADGIVVSLSEHIDQSAAFARTYDKNDRQHDGDYHRNYRNNEERTSRHATYCYEESG